MGPLGNWDLFNWDLRAIETFGQLENWDLWAIGTFGNWDLRTIGDSWIILDQSKNKVYGFLRN